MSVSPVLAQSFYFGADLSYVHEMEDCGAVYTVDQQPEDLYSIFQTHGCNLVRLRLWHTPSWYDALNAGNRYSDLEDVRASIARAKALGMSVLLDFHLSDTWADPSHQVVPAAWNSVVHQTSALSDSVFNYVYGVLSDLAQDNLLPDIVQFGNETNRSILLTQVENDQGWSFDAGRNADFFRAAQLAADVIEVTFNHPIQTALHFANPSQVEWYTDQHVINGYSDFDIIGISYYWQWHQPVTIQQLGQTISKLRADFPGKKVMVFETAYGWTTANADASNNILFNAHPSYTPLSPANQKKWMTDLTQTVIDNGGSGVIYWEPAWVSTGCSTQWAVGSAWDNATFFDFNHELMADGGIGWMSYPYDFTSSIEDGHVDQPLLNVTYQDHEIVLLNADELTIHSPARFNLYGLDGRLIQSLWIPLVEQQIIRVPIQSLVPGCYLVSIADQAMLNYRGVVCIHQF